MFTISLRKTFVTLSTGSKWIRLFSENGILLPVSEQVHKSKMGLLVGTMHKVQGEELPFEPFAYGMPSLPILNF